MSTAALASVDVLFAGTLIHRLTKTSLYANTEMAQLVYHLT